MKVTIESGEQAYMWIVTDLDTREQWCYYDGASGHKFLYKHKEETGHKMAIGTLPIEDLKSV